MQNHKTISENIYQQINRAEHILLISHKKPDGDTLGANLALFTYLHKLNKKVVSFCLDPVPSQFNFLPHSHLISSDHKLFTKKYDLIITIDCATLEYAGVDGLMTALPMGYTLINIDHHISNPRYGDIALVIDDASSASEIVYRLFADWKIEWSQDIATALACGLITDTNGFKNDATNYQTLKASAALINHGAQTHQIVQSALNNTSLNNLKLWGIALERLQKSARYDLIYTYITQEDIKNCQVDDSATEGIINFLHILKEGSVIMLLREKSDGMIAGSLRTTTNIDLTKLAALFGGGGHKKAAGFSLPGRLVYDNNRLRIE